MSSLINTANEKLIILTLLNVYFLVSITGDFFRFHIVNDWDDIDIDTEVVNPSLSQFFNDCPSQPFSKDAISKESPIKTVMRHTQDFSSQVDQLESFIRKAKQPLSLRNTIKGSQKEANKKEVYICQIRASERQASEKQYAIILKMV